MLMKLDAGRWVDTAEIVTVSVGPTDDTAVVHLRDGREFTIELPWGQARHDAVEALVERINRARLEP